MSDELKYLSQRVVRGILNRRDFLGRASALGVSSTFAGTLLANAARAQLPKVTPALDRRESPGLPSNAPRAGPTRAKRPPG